MKRQLIATPSHDGRERTVTFEEAAGNGRFRFAIDGQLHEVDGRQIRPGTWSILIDGRNFIVDVEQQRSGGAASLVATVGPTEVCVTLQDARERQLAASTGVGRTAARRGELVRAPIAGKVVKVLVAVGESIAAKTPVIAIEAMKMENELVCEHGGTVAAIHKSVGQSVERGEPLIELA